MKIEKKISLSYSIVFSIILLIVNAVIVYVTSTSIIKQSVDHIDTVSSTKAENINLYLNNQKEIITLMAASTIFHDFLSQSTTSANFKIEKERAISSLNRSLKSDKNINEMFIISKDGKVIASTERKREGDNKLTDVYFTEGKKKPYIKEIYFSNTTKNISWGLSAPINDDKTGELLGVIAIRLYIDPFYSILENRLGLGDTGETFLINKEKYFLSPSRFLGVDVVLKNKVETENAVNCFDQKEISKFKINNDYSSLYDNINHESTKIYRDYRNKLILGTHVYIPEVNWCLITKIDEIEIFTPAINIFLLSVFFTIFGVLVFIFLSKIISKKITFPIIELTKDTEIISNGDLNHKVLITSNDEIGVLSNSFNKMTSSIKKIYSEIDERVKKQTTVILEKAKDLEDQRKAILNILEDVEEEKNKSQNLAYDLQKFKLAVDSTAEHVVITDTEGLVLYANKAVTKITGFDIKDILGKKAGDKNLWGGLMDIKIYEDFWKQIKIDKKPFSGEFNNKRKNGEKYTAEANVAPVLNNKGEVTFFVGIERDVTKAKEVDRMKTEFISLASHQLRTPLSAMKWFSEMLLNGDAGKLTKEQNEFVSNVYESNERMIELVNSLLNISRIESGRIIIDPKPTDLKKLIDDVVKELKNKIDEKKQNVVISVHNELPKINLDPALIREVYKNLLTNAIKYSPEKGEISIFVSKKKDDVITQISDNGFGIPKEEQEKVFQKFYRGGNIIKLVTEGSGLGLYLVKAIIESSKGKIWFESEDKKGTTFWFSLPLKGVEFKKGEVIIDS